MKRAGLIVIVWLTTLSASSVSTNAQETGRDIYLRRCFWCHGEQGRGDGPSAVGMLPRSRDFVRADYKIRSTPHGQLPTDEDLLRVIMRGLPGTPMPGWENVLTQNEIEDLVTYLKSLSPRFQTEKPEPLGAPPTEAGSSERGKEVYRKGRCFLCHGESGRGDGEITSTLNFEWGLPHSARDLTRGWTFKGGHEPRDIYLRITGGLNGTPMGPYQDLLSDQERWDLAHYVASLDQEPAETSNDFVVVAAKIEGDIPEDHDAPEWEQANQIVVPLAGQIVLDPPLRWWIPTTGSAIVRALHNDREIAFFLEWNDPTGEKGAFADSALLQFAAQDTSKPYFLFGDLDNPVRVWHWQTGSSSEEWTATGTGSIEAHPANFRVSSSWKEGRWRLTFRRALAGEPTFEPGKFVPILFSVRDGANGETGNVRAISTWLYATVARPPSMRPWLLALACVFGAAIGELWILAKLKS